MRRFYLLALGLLVMPLALWAQDEAPPTAPGPPADSAADADPGTGDEATGGAADGAAGDGAAGEASEDTADGGDESVAESDASAQEEGESVWETGALGLLRKGGFFMWPILIMGILATGVIIERYRTLKMVNPGADQLRREVSQLLEEDRIEEALKLCDSKRGPVAAVLTSGLRKYYVLRRLDPSPALIGPEVTKAMDDYTIHITAALEKHVPILATVASVAPMLGFLGTVQGMIVSFDNIQQMVGKVSVLEAAAGGIGVSLLTTCFGLIIGIPAFIAFNYFTSIINRYVLDIEESSADLVEAVTMQLAITGRVREAEHSL